MACLRKACCVLEICCRLLWNEKFFSDQMREDVLSSDVVSFWIPVAIALPEKTCAALCDCAKDWKKVHILDFTSQTMSEIIALNSRRC